MAIFSNSKSNDYWNFNLTNGNLNFSFTYYGKKQKKVLDYKVAYNETDPPFLVTLQNNKKLNCYRWMDNRWYLKEWGFENYIIDKFLAAKDLENSCHLIVNLYLYNKNRSGSNREILHIYNYKDNWYKNVIFSNQEKIIDLKFLKKNNTINLAITRKQKQNKDLEIYSWCIIEKKWIKEIVLPFKGIPLTIEYSPDNNIYVIALIKDKVYKLEYKRVDFKNKSEHISHILLFPTYLPRKCFIIKENNLTAVYCSNFDKSYLYYSKDEYKWVEIPIHGTLEKINNTSGYITSNISLKKINNIEFNTSTFITLSNFIKLVSLF